MAYRIGRERGCATYFFSGEEFAIPPQSESLIGIASRALWFEPTLYHEPDAAEPGEVATIDRAPHILASFANSSALSTEDFGRGAVTVELRLVGSELAAVPHQPAGGPGELIGPAVDSLARRIPGSVTPCALGQLVLDLAAARPAETEGRR